MHCRTEHSSEADTPSLPRIPQKSADVATCCDAANTSKWPRTEIADRRLLGAMSTGSRTALARLHLRYFSRLVKFFAHLMPLSAPEVIDDLIADTLFEVWRRSATFASDSSVHVAIMRVAWEQGGKHLADSDARRPYPQVLSRNRGEAWLWSQVAVPKRVSEIFDALTPAGRAIIHLVYSGHSREEVAAVLSVPCEAVDACLTSWRTAHDAGLVTGDLVTTGVKLGAEH